MTDSAGAPPVPPPHRLQDGDLTLRLHRSGDVPEVQAHCADPLTAAWTSVASPFTTEDAEEFVLRTVPLGWRNGGYLALAIEVDGRYCGTVDLVPDGAGAAELGYALAPWARGRGVATRSVRLMVAWGMAAMDLQVVHWRSRQGNWASRRVAWATGFAVEGTVRSYLTGSDGQRHPAWVGSLLRSDPMTPRTPWFQVPTLTGSRVRLRRHALTDAPAIAVACSGELVQRWLPQLPRPYLVGDAVAHVLSREELHATGRGLGWALANPDTDVLIGDLALTLSPSRGSDAAEIGYWAHPDGRGRGAITEAVQLAARHALARHEDGGLGITSLQLRSAEGNHASRAVAARCGFRLVGRLRDGERLRDGSHRDLLLHDLLATDLR